MHQTLAKKLKDAGFPQAGPCRNSSPGPGEDVLPSLEDLIAACGDEFASLNHDGQFWNAEGFTPGMYFWAETPAEAVARLWLGTRANPVMQTPDMRTRRTLRSRRTRHRCHPPLRDSGRCGPWCTWLSC